ncbi:MAG TPA: sigma-70 family RNA polymerase sigma factor [Haliangiales bacterium]|nr:sigma-70 family RNA polymerase sigma factor [Haliangiales bacterium]
MNDRLFELASLGPRAWPKIAWPIEDFASELEKRELADLDPERIADVYLAWACARGDPAALAAFDERFGKDLRMFASQTGLPTDLAEDVIQDVRRVLFVGQDGEPPRIGQFVGRGELRGWLRVTMVRQAIDASKRVRARHKIETAPLDMLAAPVLDLDSELTMARHRDDFGAAFAEALEALTPRERALLRCRYLDGLTEDEVASMYAVHRVTVARWVGRALARVLRETRRGLERRLSLRTDDVTSLIRLLRTQLPFSLRRGLGGDKP